MLYLKTREVDGFRKKVYFKTRSTQANTEYQKHRISETRNIRNTSIA